MRYRRWHGIQCGSRHHQPVVSRQGRPVFRGTPDAVSYTHLDVYKRQGEGQAGYQRRGDSGISARGREVKAARTTAGRRLAGSCERAAAGSKEKARKCVRWSTAGWQRTSAAENKGEDRRTYDLRSFRTVSYTHLDVYKRKGCSSLRQRHVLPGNVGRR